jgi:hypothetical protein
VALSTAAATSSATRNCPPQVTAAVGGPAIGAPQALPAAGLSLSGLLLRSCSLPCSVARPMNLWRGRRARRIQLDCGVVTRRSIAARPPTITSHAGALLTAGKALFTQAADVGLRGEAELLLLRALGRRQMRVCWWGLLVGARPRAAPRNAPDGARERMLHDHGRSGRTTVAGTKSPGLPARHSCFSRGARRADKKAIQAT